MAIDTQMTVTPQVRKLETSANYGKFDIEPLDPGFGTTLGNTLRGVLLSSLWGAAVTSIHPRCRVGGRERESNPPETGSLPHSDLKSERPTRDDSLPLSSSDP